MSRSLTQYPIVVEDLADAHVDVLDGELDVEIVEVEVGLAGPGVGRDGAPHQGPDLAESRVERAVAARRQDDQDAGTARQKKTGGATARRAARSSIL